jgi:Flp pilus assembly protein TadB
MFVLMMLMNRDYAGVLLNHPALIWGTLISESLGALWIRKIVNFEF